MNISNIILWKYGSGTCDFMVRNGELIWEDNNISRPTDSELNSWELECQAEYDAQEYARNRKAEYDALNQFELMSDDDVNGTTTHKDAIAAIKTKYPKG
jgi:hypothetical protein